MVPLKCLDKGKLYHSCELVILDLFGTIIPSDSCEAKPRQGLFEFLEAASPKPIAIFSDACEQEISIYLRDVGIEKYISRVFGASYCFIEKKIDEQECAIYANVKELSCACDFFYTKPQNALFIGDNHAGVDKYSAIKYGVPFVHIPQYRLANPQELVKQSLFPHVMFEDATEQETSFSFTSLVSLVR